jgi:hypothetical protein
MHVIEVLIHLIAPVSFYDKIVWIFGCTPRSVKDTYKTNSLEEIPEIKSILVI